MKIITLDGWRYYVNPQTERMLFIRHCGKWMYFFDTSGLDFAERMCRKAVEDGVVAEAKHTDNMIVPLINSGVCCFYCDGRDVEQHKKILLFFIENKMIRRTASGKLANISFKFDAQTLNCQYKTDFKAKICLSDFMDLKTGVFHDDIQLNLNE